LAIGPAQRMSLSAQVAEESASVIDHYRAVRAGLYRLYDAALEAGDRTGGSLVAARLLTCLDSMARLTGQLAVSPLISHQHLHLHFSEHPAFVEFIEHMGQILEPYPEARLAIFRAVEALEHEGAPSGHEAPGLQFAESVEKQRSAAL
jgi:hypothetical protein